MSLLQVNQTSTITATIYCSISTSNDAAISLSYFSAVSQQLCVSQLFSASYAFISSMC
jgi:hypothetical protein